MNTKTVSYLLGKVFFFLGAIYLIPFLVALVYGDAGRWIFPACMGICLAAGLGCRTYGSFNKYTENISNRDGIITVVLAWVLVAFLSGIPYVLAGMLDPVSAYFEAMSGLTTTGATALSEIEGWPMSLLFWRPLTHWLGGLGIIVIFIALLPQISGSAAHLFNAEVSGFTSDKLKPRLKSTALTLFGIYSLITAVTMVALMCCGLNWYDAISHAMSAVATGGFSNYNDSVAHFHSVWVEGILGASMIISAANFALYFQMTRKGPRVLWEDEEFHYYILMVFGVIGLITLDLMLEGQGSLGGSLRDAFFNVASFASTTGYVASNYETWPSFSKLLLAVLYFTGACAGSTAGGIKVSRFVVLAKAMKAEFRHMMHPHNWDAVKYNGKELGKDVVFPILAFFCLYLLSTVVLSILVTATGVPLLESLSGVAACISSVGPGFGFVGAVGNYSTIPAAGKLVLSLAMLLGRLELFTVLVLCCRDFWRSSSKW